MNTLLIFLFFLLFSKSLQDSYEEEHRSDSYDHDESDHESEDVEDMSYSDESDIDDDDDLMDAMIKIKSKEFRRRFGPGQNRRPPWQDEFRGPGWHGPPHMDRPKPRRGRHGCKWQQCPIHYIAIVLVLSDKTTRDDFRTIKDFIIEIAERCPNENYSVTDPKKQVFTGDHIWCKDRNSCSKLLEKIDIDNVTVKPDDSGKTEPCSDAAQLMLWEDADGVLALFDKHKFTPSLDYGAGIYLLSNCIESGELLKHFFLIHRNHGYDARVVMLGNGPNGWNETKNRKIGFPLYFVPSPNQLIDRSLKSLSPCIPKREVSTSANQDTLFVLYIVFPVVIAMIVIACLIFCYQRKKFVWKHKVAKFSHNHGSGKDGEDSVRKASTTSWIKKRSKRYIDFPLNELQNTDEWELPRTRLSIHYETKLGSGAFSTVYKGHIVGEAPVNAIHPTTIHAHHLADCAVAVKVLPDYADAFSKSDFMQVRTVQEINFMKALGYHPHLVSMLGCTTVGQPLCLILEYCNHGDLLHYVRNRKVELVKAEESDGLRFKDLLCFAWQISDGMSYLSSKGCIHRDVAARNVLVDSTRTAKVGDFGLCRQIDQAIYTTRGGRLPIKWMALESLRYYEYTVMSDVWSYGVLLYEVFSLGETPYNQYQPAEMTEILAAGTRLEKPENCPEDIYEIMVSCWRENPHARSTFEQIRESLKLLLESATETYGYLNPVPAIDAAED